jgi:hypothetical protein
MWILVGASPTGPTSSGEDVDFFSADSKGEELSAPSEAGLLACHCYIRATRGTKMNFSLLRGGDRFPAWLVIT